MANGTCLSRISPLSLETFVSSWALLSFLALLTRWSRQSRCSLCSWGREGGGGGVLGMKSPTKQRKFINHMHVPPSFLLPSPLFLHLPSLPLSLSTPPPPPPPPSPLLSLSPIPLPPTLSPPSTLPFKQVFLSLYEGSYALTGGPASPLGPSLTGGPTSPCT